MDISKTIEADSTQVNADDLTGAPRTVTITGVSAGTADQPVNIELAEFPGRSYRPCKSMRRVLVAAWGSEASCYVGRRMTIYNDTTVKWGGLAVGGIRISHLSDIDKKLSIALTVTRGKRAPFVVEPLVQPLPDAAPEVDWPSTIAECTDRDQLAKWWQVADPKNRKLIEARANELKAAETPDADGDPTLEPGFGTEAGA